LEAGGLGTAGDAAFPVDERGAISFAQLVVSMPVLEEALVDERSVEHAVMLVGVADGQLLDPREEALPELVVDRGVDDYVPGRGAALSAGAVGGEDGGLDGVVEVGVAHDDQRVLAAEFQRGVQQVATGYLAYLPANLGAACEREL